MNQEILIEKIRKLQTKANDKATTEAEAALYAQKVSQLLQQHNLTQAAIDLPEEREEVTEDQMYNSKTGDPWAQALATSVARLYFCDIYLSLDEKRKVKIVFVGKPHNIAIAMSMTEYLVKTVGRLAREYARSPEAKADWHWTFTRARNGFERGAGSRLTERIRILRAEQTNSAPVRNSNGNPGNLPALYQDEEKLIQAYKATLGLRTYGRGYSVGGDHAAHGANAANSISLNQQVGSGKTNLLS